MPLTNPPPHLRELIENVSEVALLLRFHKDAAGIGPGRKYDVEILNKSAIVMVVACWEAYVEDLAASSLDHLVNNAQDHNAFPKAVLERVANKNQGLNAWKLAGDGWKTSLRDNLSEVLAKTVGSLNTPKIEQVDELFLKTVGHPKLSSKWSWPGRAVGSAAKDLDALVTLRGGIAHRVKSSRSVRKVDVTNAIDLVSRLAERSNNEMHAYLHKLTKIDPWQKVKYRGFKPR